MPNNLTIIALGNIAFNFCALRFPQNFVLGLPRPTGAYGTFSKLKKNILSKPKKYLNEIIERKDDRGHFRAIKLFI